MSAAYSAVFVPLVVGLSLYALPSELRAQQRAPVPDASAQDTSRKAATEIYGGRFRQVKTTAEKIALAAEMIEAAAKVEKGSADQYVLLKIASDVSSGAGDAPTALQAIEKLAECFDVPTAKLIGETLSTAARNASTSNQQKTLGEAVLGMADAIADEEEFELVLSLCEAARSSAQKARQYALAKDLTAKIEEIKKRQSAAQEYRAAWAVLDKNPTEPAANLAAGRYECFVMGKWDTGVAKLALGSDGALKEVAIKDLREANSAEGQAAIGDAWWTLAETNQGSEQDMLRLRAGFWYRQAEPNLTGLIALKVKQRLEELGKLGRDVPEPPRVTLRDRVVSKPLRLASGLVLRVFPRQPAQDDNRYVAHVSPSQFGPPIGPPLLIPTSEYKHDVSTNAIAFGYLKIDVAGDYTFRTVTGYDRAALYLNAKEVNAFRDGETKQTTVPLDPGMVPIAVVGWTMYEHVETHWLPPGATEPTLIPTAFLFHDPNQPVPSLVEKPDGKGHLLAETMPTLPKTEPKPALTPTAKAGTNSRQPSRSDLRGREVAGLMGRARVSGSDVSLVLRYQPGKTLRQQAFEDLLLKQGISSRDVQIELAGALRLVEATSVLIKHKGGSSERGVLRLHLNGRELGAVGDDRTKDTTYQVELPAGIHVIRWVLTGGAIGNSNMIEFLDSQTNQSLPVHVPAEAAAQVRSVPFKSEVDVSSD
jgi:hypothetical protein